MKAREGEGEEGERKDKGKGQWRNYGLLRPGAIATK